MLEYTLDDAEELLRKNKESAEKTISQTAFDLVGVLRGSCSRRVFNFKLGSFTSSQHSQSYLKLKKLSPVFVLLAREY
jgi:hypothetical protein